jgi:ribosomal protein L24
MKTHTTDKLASSVEVNFCDSPGTVEKRINPRVMVDAVKLIAANKNDMVISLRDKGQIEEAKRVNISNVDFLKANAIRYDSDELLKDSLEQQVLNEKLDKEEDYKRSRKVMREGQYRSRTQQQE